MVVLRGEQGQLSLKFVDPVSAPRPQWPSLLEFAKKPGFPGNTKGQVVRLMNDQAGRVVKVIEGGKKFTFRLDSTGQVMKLSTSYFLRLHGRSIERGLPER